MALKEDTRSLHLATPLGKDALQLISFTGTEEISNLFFFEMEMISKDTAVIPKSIVGKNVTISIDFGAEDHRYFNGFVQRFVGGNQTVEGIRHYHAIVVPWLWFLTQRTDCRIFQNLTVVEVIEQVFAGLGFTDFDKSQVSSEQSKHPKREYWVQYRESDFNFVSRLMEEEGIFYYFKQENGKHTLIMADNGRGYAQCKEYEVECPSTEQSTISFVPHIRDWSHQYQYRSGGWEHTDYNFKTPTSDLRSSEKTLVEFENATKLQVYDYPGRYEDKSFGNSLSRVRMEEIESDHDMVLGTSDCKSFSPGQRFRVKKHRVPDEVNKEYVLRRVTHRASGPSYESGGQASAAEYSNSFECFPSKISFRPPRTTPKPVIHGCQTAEVTGPPGEEIYVDKYGRIKVQFHWDRLGKKDQNTTRWIRCKQSIAGNKWGFMSIPRIGQEVVVDFLEGDPDQPLVTGCVYNDGQMPHYTLPDEKTKTYIKTNSTKGGQGHNELMFEDLAGSERVYVHAEKDMDVRVKNNSTERILGNRHQIIGVEKDGQKVGDQCERVYRDKHLNVKRNHFEHIEGNMQLLIGGGEGDSGNQDIVIEKDKAELIKGDSHLIVQGAFNQKVSGGLSMQVTGDAHTKSGGNIAQESGPMGEIHLKGGMKVIIEAGMQLSLKAAGGFIDIGPSGVTIQGMMVNVNSGGAAGTGSGCSPTAPKEAQKAAPKAPMQAHDSNSGMKSSKS
jgi:type VI secretion system secreted protein VgrG